MLKHLSFISLLHSYGSEKTNEINWSMDSLTFLFKVWPVSATSVCNVFLWHVPCGIVLNSPRQFALAAFLKEHSILVPRNFFAGCCWFWRTGSKWQYVMMSVTHILISDELKCELKTLIHFLGLMNCRGCPTSSAPPSFAPIAALGQQTVI